MPAVQEGILPYCVTRRGNNEYLPRDGSQRRHQQPPRLRRPAARTIALAGEMDGTLEAPAREEARVLANAIGTFDLGPIFGALGCVSCMTDRAIRNLDEARA